ncbi:MAG: hypothetical protein ABSF68_17485, partial [Candidatus Acidiferrales bacterium]
STGGLTWEPDKGDPTAAQAVRSAASDKFLRVPLLGLPSRWRLRVQFRSQAVSFLLPLVLTAADTGMSCTRPRQGQECNVVY